MGVAWLAEAPARKEQGQGEAAEGEGGGGGDGGREPAGAPSEAERVQHAEVDGDEDDAIAELAKAIKSLAPEGQQL